MNENHLERLTDQIYYLPPNADTDRPILSAICGKHQTLVVDAGNSQQHAQLFLTELEKHQATYLHAVVLTHWHWDHSFGASAWHKPILAHEKTKSYLEEISSYDWSDQALEQRVEAGLENQFCADMIKKEYGANRDISIMLPNITFTDKLEIDLGQIHCVVKHVGGDHSDNSSIVFVEEDQVLFLGDCLYPSLYTKAPHYKVENVLSLLEKIEEFNAETYVLAHQAPLSKAEFKGYSELLKLFCHLTVKHGGKKAEFTKELSDQLGRGPNQLEEEIMGCFINGVGEEHED